MRLFKKESVLVSAADGRALPLSAVPDEAFASGLLGVGLAIEPASDRILSPAAGRIESVSETAHAYSILTDDGLDLLVHVGIDTALSGRAMLVSVEHPQNA